MSARQPDIAKRWLLINIAAMFVVIAAATIFIVVRLKGEDYSGGYYGVWDGGLGQSIAAALGAASLIFGLTGLVRLRLADISAKRTIAFWLSIFLVFGAIDLFWAALTGSPLSATAVGQGLGSTALLLLVLLGLLALVRLALSRGSGVMGVARTLIDEALRLKIALVFMVLLLVLLPLLPFTVGTDDPVRYRVQQFLGYGHTLTAVLLSLMTIFLACWTLTSEVSDKQIFTIATKPIGRGSYLLGKWLGIVLLNGVLVTVASLAIYGFTVGYLAQLQPHNALDYIELKERVLVSRVSASPRPEASFEEQAQKRLEKMVREEPATIRELGRVYATELGLGAVGEQEIMALGTTRAKDQLMITAETEWMSVGPLRTQRYVFEGLKNASAYGEAVQWRYKASTSETVPDDQLKVLFRVNESSWQPIRMVVGTVQEIPIRAELIGPEGVLVLDVRHFNPERNGAFNSTISFRAKEMKMLFQVDSFGPNFTRAMIVVWIKLAFLAMLGLLCATFLSFPVAAVLSLLVYGAAVLSPFVLDALGGFTGRTEGVEAAVKGFLATIAYVVSATLSAWAAYDPGPMIVDGLHFSWGRVLGCLAWIGIVWTGMAGVIAWLVFRKRELARVQV